MSETENMTKTPDGVEAADAKIEGTEADEQAEVAPDATHENTGA